MAISPLAIATQGVLNSPLSVAAVRGHLTLVTVPPPPEGGGGGTKPRPGQWIHPYVLKERLDDQVQREEEEILAIIIAATRIIG